MRSSRWGLAVCAAAECAEAASCLSSRHSPINEESMIGRPCSCNLKEPIEYRSYCERFCNSEIPFFFFLINGIISPLMYPRGIQERDEEAAPVFEAFAIIVEETEPTDGEQ